VYENLEPVANLRIVRAIERISKARTDKIVQVNSEYATRGLSRSGMLGAAKIKLSLDSAQEICRETANTWRELIVRNDGKLSPSSIAFIVAKVSQVGQSQARNILASSQMGGSAGLPASTSEQLRQGIDSVVANIRRDLEIERRERDLFPPELAALNREVFVIMAASRELEDLYAQSISPAVRENGLEPFLMIQREPKASISNEILSRIEGAKLILADLTFERQNCYYEVGYAQAKGKKVLFTGRSDHDPRRANRQPGDPKIHFDLDSHRFSFWEPGDWTNLRTELSKRIREALHDLNMSPNISDRLGEKGESEVLTYLRETQSRNSGALLFYDHFVAQGLGWPLDEIRLLLKRLVEKGWITPLADGYTLKQR
jgi:nucleoside 2-deoxyribosyltransferase